MQHRCSVGQTKRHTCTITWDTSHISNYPKRIFNLHQYVKSVLTFMVTRGLLYVWNHLKLSRHLPPCTCCLPNTGPVHGIPLKEISVNTMILLWTIQLKVLWLYDYIIICNEDDFVSFHCSVIPILYMINCVSQGERQFTTIL